MLIKVANSSYSKAWNEYLKSKERSLPYARFEWSDIISQSYNITSIMIIAIKEEKQICGIMPLYKIYDYFNRPILYSLKQSFIYDDQDICNAIIKFVNDYAIKDSIHRLVISPFSQNCKLVGFDIRKTKTVAINIDGSEEIMWAHIRAKTRNMIKKAKKENIIIENNKENLEDFYNIYTKRMLEKGVRVHSKIFFQNISFYLNNNIEIFTAKKNNKIIGTMYLLYSNRVGAYAYGGSELAKGASPNQLLLWNIVKYCISKNLNYLDLGESVEGSGVYNFKIWFGGKPKDIVYNEFEYKSDSSKGIKNFLFGNLTRIISYIIIQYGTKTMREKVALWKRIKGPLF